LYNNGHAPGEGLRFATTPIVETGDPVFWPRCMNALVHLCAWLNTDYVIHVLQKKVKWRNLRDCTDLVPRVDWSSVTRPETKKIVPRISLSSFGSVTHMAGATISATLRLAPKHVRLCCKQPRHVLFSAIELGGMAYIIRQRGLDQLT